MINSKLILSPSYSLFTKKKKKKNDSILIRVLKRIRALLEESIKLHDCTNIESRVASILPIRGRMYRAKIIQVKLFWAKGTANRYQSDYVFIVITAYIDFQTKLCVIYYYAIICSIISSFWYHVVYNYYTFIRLYLFFDWPWTD